MAAAKTRNVWQYGDFQTPDQLASAVCARLRQFDVAPAGVIEPCCGRGSFLAAAADAFPDAHQLVGVEINADHLRHASDRLGAASSTRDVCLTEGDFFAFDWDAVLSSTKGDVLILGNPPWVTSAELGFLGSTNLPTKSNFQSRSGIEAITGKSNFDISEWMLLQHLKWLNDRRGWLAMLVKTIVARKVLAQAWRDRCPIETAAIFPVDAMEHFGASVDACLLFISMRPNTRSSTCSVYGNLSDPTPSNVIGFHDGQLVADEAGYHRWHHLGGYDPRFVWRSGIKHDAAKVMEFSCNNGKFVNGLGEQVDLEPTLLYPLLKSSDVNRRQSGRQRYMLVTQRRVGDDTRAIEIQAPKTWRYLQKHADLLARRASSIYKNRPPFSVFGVGDYSFATWKVAISGFYKNLHFVPVGPISGRPVVFDDTVYFLPCRSEAEAGLLAECLNSEPAQQFFASMVFWNDKRPITVDLLKRLSLSKLAEEQGRMGELQALQEDIARPTQMRFI